MGPWWFGCSIAERNSSLSPDSWQPYKSQITHPQQNETASNFPRGCVCMSTHCVRVRESREHGEAVYTCVGIRKQAK